MLVVCSAVVDDVDMDKTQTSSVCSTATHSSGCCCDWHCLSLVTLVAAAVTGIACYWSLFAAADVYSVFSSLFLGLTFSLIAGCS